VVIPAVDGVGAVGGAVQGPVGADRAEDQGPMCSNRIIFFGISIVSPDDVCIVNVVTGSSGMVIIKLDCTGEIYSPALIINTASATTLLGCIPLDHTSFHRQRGIFIPEIDPTSLIVGDGHRAVRCNSGLAFKA